MSSNDELPLLRAALQDAKTALPAVILGSLLLGIFTLLLAFSGYILSQKGLHTRAQAAMFAAVVLMYAIAITFWALTVSSVTQAIADPARYALLNAHSITSKSQVLLACQGLNFWLSDIIVTWRTWILWRDRPRARWVVGGVPVVLFVGVIVSGLVDFAIDVRLSSVTVIYPSAGRMGYYNAVAPLYVSASGKVGAVLSAALNVWCVLLAVIKSWQYRQLQKLSGGRLYNRRAGMILVLLASCGAIYCIFWVYWVAVSLRNLPPHLNTTLLLSNNIAAVQINAS